MRIDIIYRSWPAIGSDGESLILRAAVLAGWLADGARVHNLPLALPPGDAYPGARLGSAGRQCLRFDRLTLIVPSWVRQRRMVAPEARTVLIVTQSALRSRTPPPRPVRRRPPSARRYGLAS